MESAQSALKTPIVFASAEDTRRLFAWGILDSVIISTGTKYRFLSLREFNPRPLKTTLKKRDGETLAAGFIRSYAVDERTPAVDLDLLITSADEGERKLVLHLRSERSRRILTGKKRDVLRRTGRLACEACEFNFRELYGQLGANFMRGAPQPADFEIRWSYRDEP